MLLLKPCYRFALLALLFCLAASASPAFAGGGSGTTYVATDIRYSFTLSRICSGQCGGTASPQIEFHTIFAPGDFMILGGQASQPGLYQVLAVDTVHGRWVTVSPRPQAATDQALNVEVSKVGPLPLELTKEMALAVDRRGQKALRK